MATRKEIKQDLIQKITKITKILNDLEEIRELYDLHEGSNITSAYLSLEELLSDELMRANRLQLIKLKEGDE